MHRRVFLKSGGLALATLGWSPWIFGRTALAAEAVEPRAVGWLRKQWATMMRLRQDGIPIMGFTWYSLTDQVDWDSALRADAGRVNPVGLCNLDRRVRPAGDAYRQLIQRWRHVLATQNPTLQLSA